MASELADIFFLLSSPPGNWIYHLIICFAMVLTIAFAFSKLAETSKSDGKPHLLWGSLILLIFQVVLICISLIKTSDIFTTSLTYALVERLIAALSAIWLIWIIYDRDQSIFNTSLSIIFSAIFILLALAFILLANLRPESILLQGQNLELIWQSCILLTLLFGSIFIVRKKPRLWTLGITMLLVLAIGHLIQLLNIDRESYAMGAVRLSQLISLCWMPILTQASLEGKKVESGITSFHQQAYDEKRVDLKPILMDQLLKISLQHDREEKLKAIVKAISLGIVADICYLAQVSQENNIIHLIAGYDLIREIYLEPTSLDGKALPNMMDAWLAGSDFQANQIQMDPQEAKTIIDLLNYPRTGNLFAYPLYASDQRLVGGVIFISPYTDKHWNDQNIDLMHKIESSLERVLFGKDPQATFKATLDEIQASVEKLIKEKNILSQILAEKELQIKDQETDIKQLQAKNQIERIEIERNQEKMKVRIETLKKQVASMQSDVQLEQMRTQIRQLIDEKEQLRMLLSRSEARIQDLESQTGQTGPIRLSMENQIISLDSVAANLKMQMRSNMQNKNINLEIVNPDGRQMIRTDPELVQNILIGLVDNAIQVSEPGAAIQLNQKLSFETGMLIIEVTDFGEGLSPQEQTVFFTAEKEIIPGIGSIRSIRNAIRAIRVLNGKIWLRSKKGNFTTFRVQLPVRIID